jgi:hypothetical protein
MTKLTIKKSFSSPVTKIYILNFLDELESGILRRVKEDMILIANLNSNKSMTDLKFIQSFNIKRESDCNLAIETIIEDVKINQEFPLIHIQGHGSKDYGVRCINNGYIEWSKLILFFDKLVRLTKGELTVIAAACYSFELTSIIQGFGKMPYSFYYGYHKAIQLGDMEADLQSLYKNFLANNADISNSSLNIKVHSEYDNLIVLERALFMLIYPERASEIGLSKRALKTKIKLDLPASEERKLLNSIIKSPLLAESVVNNLFHPTKRRDTLIECLNNYFSNIISKREVL